MSPIMVLFSFIHSVSKQWFCKQWFFILYIYNLQSYFLQNRISPLPYRPNPAWRHALDCTLLPLPAGPASPLSRTNWWIRSSQSNSTQSWMGRSNTTSGSVLFDCWVCRPVFKFISPKLDFNANPQTYITSFSKSLQSHVVEEFPMLSLVTLGEFKVTLKIIRRQPGQKIFAFQNIYMN